MNESTDNVWERFARADAEHYILTDRREYATPEGRAFFVESGRRDAQALLAETAQWRSRSERAVEIGCGVGRLAIPMAAEFDEVRAVDVAPTMLEKLAANCREAGVSNVLPFLAGDAWDDTPADLVYSRLVFQHIVDSDEIRRYVQRVGRCLREDGVASLHFDTRRKTSAYRLRNRLPERALPRDWRRGIRRIRRSRETLLDLFAGAGLAVAAEAGAGTAENVFVLTRAR
jgi:SAM-dependent methyltransferase